MKRKFKRKLYSKEVKWQLDNALHLSNRPKRWRQIMWAQYEVNYRILGAYRVCYRFDDFADILAVLDVLDS